MISTLISSKVFATAFAAAAMSMGVIAWSPPAEARFGGGHGFHGGGHSFRGGGMAFRGGGFARHGFAGPVFARPGFAHRAVFFHGRRLHHNRFFIGPAFALGIGVPYYYNNYYDDDCYYAWRRRFDPWGYVVTRRVLVCP